MSQITRTQGLVGNVGLKAPVAAATTGNITLYGVQTIDGVAVVTGDRVLVKDQTNATENGIYDVDTGTWVRSADFDGVNDIVEGSMALVVGGSTNINTMWRIFTSLPIIGGILAFVRALVADSSLIGFLPAGTGAVATTVQNELRLITAYYVNNFGAVGNGVADDRAAIQNAIDTAFTAGVRRVILSKGHTYKIASAHPTKTFTLPGDDGSFWNGASFSTTTPETVDTMPVGLWLPDGVDLVFEDDTAAISGPWAYNTASAINISQVIGILISSRTNSTNPKASTITSRITTDGKGRYGTIYGFMMNVVSEGILANTNFDFKSSQSAFPFVAQGADNCNFDITTSYTKAGVIVGGQWLTMSNTISAAHLPLNPAGFGTPGAGPATDVFLLGWCDHCTFSSQMQRPDGVGGVTVAYSTFETNIDVFFDTFFFKTGSTSRLAASHDATPATTRLYIGVVGNGFMVMTRYGRSVGTPKFQDIKSYGLLRNQVYCEYALAAKVDRMYGEFTGNLNGVAFGVATNDPYGSAGISSAAFVRGNGDFIISNVFGFNSLVAYNVNVALSNYSTENCIFATYGLVDGLQPNNYNGFQNRLSSTGNQWSNGISSLIPIGTFVVGNHNFNSIAKGDIFSANLALLVPGTHTTFKLKFALVDTGAQAGYCSAYYEFAIMVTNVSGSLLTTANPGILVSQLHSVDAGTRALAATCQAAVAGSILTVSITPSTSGTNPSTAAYSYWTVEEFGRKLLPITVL